MWTSRNPFEISDFKSQIGGPSRRQMLRRMAGGFGMVGLAGMLGPRALAGTLSSTPATFTRHLAPRAKRVIFLFMNGGPSHVDTFDPKPALEKYAGQQPTGELYKKSKGSGFVPSPLKFTKAGRSGVDVSETLPNIAQVIDECCVIRSMQTDVPNHEPALLMMNTGNLQPIRPSLGSWLLYGLGTENQNLPGYVVLRPSNKIVVGPALWTSGFLPAQYQATTVLTEDMRVDKLVANVRNPALTREQQREQLDLLQNLNRHHLAARDGDGQLEGQIQTMETAFRMQAEAMNAFDVSKEPQKVRELYGETPFARSCLLARRLVEDGVRFVTVYYTSNDNQPWDTHADHDARHRKLCADSDRATSALIHDLKSRGMLDDTLVIWGGEFGRTPLNEERNGSKFLGRDHHPHCQGRPRPPPHGVFHAPRRRRRERRLCLRLLRRAGNESPGKPRPRPRPARDDPPPLRSRPREADLPLRGQRLQADGRVRGSGKGDHRVTF